MSYRQILVSNFSYGCYGNNYRGLKRCFSSHFNRSVTERGVSLKQMDIIESYQGVAEKPEQGDIACYDTKLNLSLEVDPVTAQALREYLAVVWKNYQAASKAGKGLILDELVRNVKIHRKAAIRLMNKKHSPRSQQGFKGGRKEGVFRRC